MLCDFTPASPAEPLDAICLARGRDDRQMRGALEIYGTTNRLTAAYPILCGALCLAGALGYLIAPQKMM